MKYCFGTVCWGGYLERFINMFVDNYITIFRKLISSNVNYEDIADPIVVYVNKDDTPDLATSNASEKLIKVTGKRLTLICDKHLYTQDTIMYSTRNRLRLEFRKKYSTDQKVYFYFPIDDKVRPEVASELYKLAQKTVPTACMFKFFVTESDIKYSAGTRPINSYNDIHPGDWGGYCAYNILDEDKCPLYPKIAIPNVAFYIELHKAGYLQYQSANTCVDHLRHKDSHHFKTKDTAMTKKVRDYLLEQRRLLSEKRE